MKLFRCWNVQFLSFFLYGNNFNSFKRIWYTHEEKERLKISASFFEIYFFNNLNILVGILFGVEDLSSLSEDVTEITSSLLLGVIQK